MGPAKDHPRFSKEEYDRRFREIRKRMQEKGINVLIIYGDSGSYNSNHANVKYVSNYQDLVSSYVVFPQEGEPSLHISNRLYLPYARRMSILPRTDAVDYGPGGAVEKRLRALGLENKSMAWWAFGVEQVRRIAGGKASSRAVAMAAARDLANESGENFYVDDWTRLHYTFFRSIQLQKTMMFVIVAAALALSACAQAAAPAPAAEAPAAEAPAAEAPAAEGPAAGTLACAPNCEYKDLVVGFLQTGSEGGWRAATPLPLKRPQSSWA